MSVTSGASSERKISSSSTMMKTMDSSWIWLSGAARLGLLVHLDRDRAGQVHLQAGRRAIAGDRARRSLTSVVRPLPAAALADVGQHLELRGLTVGRMAEVAHLDDGRHLAQVLLQLLQPGLLRRR